MSWSQQRLQELLGSGLPPAQLDAALGSAEITSLKSCTGEASAIEIAVRAGFAVWYKCTICTALPLTHTKQA